MSQLDPNGAAILNNGTFAQQLRSVLEEYQPRKLVETGTCVGLGSTQVLGRSKPRGAILHTIEVDQGFSAQARRNTAAIAGINFIVGLSVPRSLLPTAAEVEQSCALARQYGKDVDPDRGKEAAFYMGETHFPDVLDNQLGYVMRLLEGRPDFVMLDSAGHLGYVEFKYLMSLVQIGGGPFVLALDDVDHLKHFLSFRDIVKDKRFTLLARGAERHGFCIARFQP